MIKLVDARKGLHEKCVELFHNEKVAESIYMYLCDGIEECDGVELKWKKGKWIKKKSMIYCPSCYNGFEAIFIRDYNFCPNCGADMRGEENDS